MSTKEVIYTSIAGEEKRLRLSNQIWDGEKDITGNGLLVGLYHGAKAHRIIAQYRDKNADPSRIRGIYTYVELDKAQIKAFLKKSFDESVNEILRLESTEPEKSDYTNVNYTSLNGKTLRTRITDPIWSGKHKFGKHTLSELYLGKRNHKLFARLHGETNNSGGDRFIEISEDDAQRFKFLDKEAKQLLTEKFFDLDPKTIRAVYVNLDGEKKNFYPVNEVWSGTAKVGKQELSALYYQRRKDAVIAAYTHEGGTSYVQLNDSDIEKLERKLKAHFRA